MTVRRAVYTAFKNEIFQTLEIVTQGKRLTKIFKELPRKLVKSILKPLPNTNGHLETWNLQGRVHGKLSIDLAGLNSTRLAILIFN